MIPLSCEFCSRMFLIHLFCKLLQILFPMSPRKKMSSICLHHGYGFSSISLKTSSSNSAINNLLYGGANVVPIAVPHFYFFPYPSSSFFLKIKNIVLKKNSADSTSVEVNSRYSFNHLIIVNLDMFFIGSLRPDRPGVVCVLSIKLLKIFSKIYNKR